MFFIEEMEAQPEMRISGSKSEMLEARKRPWLDWLMSRWFSCAHEGAGSNCGHMAESCHPDCLYPQGPAAPFLMATFLNFTREFPLFLEPWCSGKSPFTVAIPRSRPLTYVTSPQKFRPKAIDNITRIFPSTT